MIGRTDCRLVAPPVDDLFERILAICRRRWPAGVFVDGGETRVVPLGSRELDRRPPADEFFVFSDDHTADAWDELGPCPENWNRMLHFILRAKGGDTPYVSVTVVVDEVTPGIRRLLDDLQDTFRDAYFFAPRLAEVA